MSSEHTFIVTIGFVVCFAIGCLAFSPGHIHDSQYDILVACHNFNTPDEVCKTALQQNSIDTAKQGKTGNGT